MRALLAALVLVLAGCDRVGLVTASKAGSILCITIYWEDERVPIRTDCWSRPEIAEGQDWSLASDPKNEKGGK